MTPTHRVNEKTPTAKGVGKAETHSCPKHQVGNPNSQLLPEEGRALITHLAPQLLKLPLEDPNHLALKAKGVCIHESLRTLVKKNGS